MVCHFLWMKIFHSYWNVEHRSRVDVKFNIKFYILDAYRLVQSEYIKSIEVTICIIQGYMHWIVKFNHKIDIAAAKAQILHNGRCCCCCNSNYIRTLQCRLYYEGRWWEGRMAASLYEWNDGATSGCCRWKAFKLYISRISFEIQIEIMIVWPSRCLMTGR